MAAANESLLDVAATDIPTAPVAASAPAPPLADASPSTTRSTTIGIHGFAAIFWAALFVMHSSQMLLTNGGRESLFSIGVRAALSVVAFLACMPIGWVIRRTLNRPLLQRILAICGVCLPIALGYSILGLVVWIEVLQNPVPNAAWVSIIVQAQYALLQFLLWSALCTAVLFRRQLLERERSLLEAQALAHEAELKMLRYQINPHFLFNTLNAVSALIVTGQAQAADAMIGKLARFFRNALSRESSAKVTLAEDVRVQVEYLNIELTRFPDRLSWSTNIDPGLEYALVPHLILQPLFENAIKHGVARSIGPVEIRLTARRERGLLIITVDNDVRPGLLQQQHTGTGVGLANVARRLVSFYGPAAGLTTTQHGDRYVVELRMPIELTL